MAFCTGCGASVTGAFCSKCGRPAGQTAATTAPAGPAAPQGSATAAATAPVRRRTSPIVWVLIVVLAFCALAIMGMIGTGLFLARRGPGYAIAKIIAAANPNAEVIRADDGTGTITIRNRRTGKTVTMSFDDARRGRFRLEAEDERGKRATVEMGDASIPSWLPSYPGSTPHGVIAAQGESDEGSGEGGHFTFRTQDPPSRVRGFYEDEARRMGLQTTLQTRGSDTSVLVAQDADEQRKMTVVITPEGGDTRVNVTYGRKR